VSTTHLEAPVELGIDLGGTKALSVARCAGHTLWRETVPTGRSFGPGECVELVVQLLARPATAGRVRAVGIGVPGPVDPAGQRVRSSVMLDGWQDVPLAELVSARTGLPCGVDNDVNNAARAELAARRGTAVAATDLLFVAVGTGIGGAVVLGGRIWPGAGGLAGEVGHMAARGVEGTCDCGRQGCVALAAGGRSIEARLGLATGSLGAGSAAAAFGTEIERGADRLGEVLADAMQLLDLPLVVLGGGLARHPGYVERVQASFHAAAMAEVARGCRVEASVAGYDAGALGAALLAAGS
jgi:glucokinase